MYRRFKIINKDKQGEFEALCEAKGISREDISLILDTVQTEVYNWKSLLKSILTNSQIAIFKQALKLNMPIHFYGRGLGKSRIASMLSNLGFDVTAPEDVGGAEGCYSVPNSPCVCICFNKSEMFIPDIPDSQILDWVNVE